jgi:hypothetical protein
MRIADVVPAAHMCVFGVGGLSRRAARRVAGLAKRHAALLERAAKRREASTR